METIAAVLIVKNEEAMLERCLETVLGADEIVIVDTGSVDNTEGVVRAFTLLHPEQKIESYFHEYAWNDSFAEARNYAKGKATADWILSIDADEVLEEDGINKLRAVIAAQPKFKCLDLWLKDGNNGALHNLPRLFRNVPEVEWKGAIHNYMNIPGQAVVNIKITYHSSPAHALDPNRAFRILKKEVAKNPRCVREKFYLAREFMYRADWKSAIEWYKRYLEVSDWGPEIAEARYQMSKAYSKIGDWDSARDECLASIGVNADYYNTLSWMAYLTGPINKERWLLMSESAQNQNVLFKPGSHEQNAGYYDSLFAGQDDFSRYDKIHDKILEMVGDKAFLDIGCGNGHLLARASNANSLGFDFSPVAVAQAKKVGVNAVVGDAYTFDYNTVPAGFVFVITEVLEHLRDEEVVARIPSGTECIITVPSFPDASHVRFYTLKSFKRRLGKYFNIIETVQFNWNGHWDLSAKYTNDYITLIHCSRV